MRRRPVMIAAVAALLFASLGQSAPPPARAASAAVSGVPAAIGPVQAWASIDKTAFVNKVVVNPQLKNPKSDSQVAAVVSSFESTGEAAALAEARAGQLVVAGSAVRLIVEASDVAVAESSVTAEGATVEGTAGSLVQILATPAQVSALMSAPGVAYIRSPMQHSMDVVPPGVIGEGVASTNANDIQRDGQTGAGVKIAIIDGGFIGLAGAQANGDIPASVTTVDDCSGAFNTATSHGTAVTEIVHEMAPDAQLTLICISTEVDLATAEAYVKANGIKIVNHSIAWFNTSRGDGSGAAGTPDAIVADATANGILWVNAAGNYATRHWSGSFVSDGSGTYPWNRFSGTDIGDGFVLANGTGTCVELKWNSWPATSQDYDLYVFRDSDGAYLDSVTTQTGSQPPVESICFNNTAGSTQTYFVAIRRYSATVAPRFDLYLTGADLQYQVAAGSVTEPASAPAAFAAGAVCWAGTTIESFSSQGPTIGGITKPDISGPDQVSTYTYGAFSACYPWTGFAGTSAASPHVAGAAALVLGANPTFTVAQLKSYLQTNSIDLGAAGNDNVYGSGLLFLPSKPGPPTNVIGVGYDSSILVVWKAPVDTGGRAITGYTATSSPEGKTCTSTGTGCTVNGLTNGTPYTFTVTATNPIGTGHASDPSTAVKPKGPTPGTFHAVPPTRILDTRTGNGLSGAFQEHVARSFQVTSASGLIPAGATAVTGNLTVTQQGGYGYLYLGPVAIDYPSSSTLNFPLADDRANAATVALSDDGKLSITYVSLGNHPTAHVIFDVTGYFTPDTTGATFFPVTPFRVLDSRNDTGVTAGKFAANAPRTFAVRGGAVPNTAIAVTGNITVTGQSSMGYLYIGPDAVSLPTSSSLNFPIGDNRANGVTVQLATDGTLSVTYVGLPGTQTTDVVFDVTGYFSPGTGGASYVALNPGRVLDTRTTTGGLFGKFTTPTPRTFQATGAVGVPTSAVAITGNLTVTEQNCGGYLYLGPDATSTPGSSTLNFPVGDNRANGVSVALASDGTLSITYITPWPGTTAHAILDVTGYFVPTVVGP
jgi:hypothetical protein